MSYLYLAGAIVLEVISTTLLGLSDGFSKIHYGIASIAIYGVCFFLLSKALKYIDLGIAYATWCSVGIVLTALISRFFFGQRLTVPGLVSLVFIMAGCIVLNMYGTAD